MSAMAGTSSSNATATTMHGIFILVASIVGVMGYVIRSRLNAKAAKAAEEDRKEEERRRAALQYVSDQHKIFIGPLKAAMEQFSASALESIGLRHGHFNKLFMEFKNQKVKDEIRMESLEHLQKLVNEDEEFSNVYIKGLRYFKTTQLQALKTKHELICKYAGVYGEFPSKIEMEKLYPGGSKHINNPLRFIMMYANWCLCWIEVLESFDGKTIPDTIRWILDDPNHLFWRRPYISTLVDFMNNENVKKRKTLLQQDMKVITDLSGEQIYAKRLDNINTYVVSNDAGV